MEDYKDNDFLKDSIITQNVKASTGKRFGNYIIDLICFYIVIFGIGIIWALINPSSLEVLDDDSLGFNLIDRIVSLLIYAVVMGLIEGFTKGKSLGKLITGTRAVNEDGSKINFQTAMFRVFCGAVPFNQLSALGNPSYPWHDKWTNTEVIDEKQSGYTNI